MHKRTALILASLAFAAGLLCGEAYHALRGSQIDRRQAKTVQEAIDRLPALHVTPCDRRNKTLAFGAYLSDHPLSDEAVSALLLYEPDGWEGVVLVHTRHQGDGIVTDSIPEERILRTPYLHVIGDPAMVQRVAKEIND